MASQTTIQTKASAQDYSLWKYAIAGAISGLATGFANNIWVFLYPYIFGLDEPPGIDAIAVSGASFIPVLVASFVFYFLTLKSVKKGTRLYIIGGVILFLASLYGPFNPAITGMYPDGIVPENFALFTIPMHIIVAIGALILVPRFVLTD